MATQTSLDTVQKAYIAFYGRPADYAGLQYWASVLDQSDGKLSAIIDSFGNSAESRDLYPGNSPSEKITRIYQQIFNRDPDTAGLNYWANEVANGNTTLQGAALAILNGATNADTAVINQKLIAAKQFTEQLHGSNTDHIYDGSALAATRSLLSKVNAHSSAAEIGNNVKETISAIYKGMEYDYKSIASSGTTQVLLGQDATYLGKSLSVSHTKTQHSYDVVISKLGADMKPVKEIYFGSTGLKNETLSNLVSLSDGKVVAYGTYNSSDAYVATFDSNLHLQKAITLGDLGSSTTYANVTSVMQLSDGNILVYGQENVIGDSYDAFAVVLDKDTLTATSQRRFDSKTATGSNEKFISAAQLDNGNIALLGSKGELVITDAHLNVIKTAEVSHTSTSVVTNLGNGLLAVWSGTAAYIYDSTLAPLSTLRTNIPGASIAALGGNHFAVNDESVETFFTLTVDSTGKHPSITIDKQIAILSRSGSSVNIDDISIKDSTVALFKSSGGNLFVYSTDQPANPNLSNDYRLHEQNPVDKSTLSNKITDTSFPKANNLEWESGDITLVGTTTDFYANSPAATLFTLTTQTSI